MTNKLNAGVGKKIVEALKQQSTADIENQEIISSSAVDGLIPNVEDTINSALDDVFDNTDSMTQVEDTQEVEQAIDENVVNDLSEEHDSFDSFIFSENSFENFDFPQTKPQEVEAKISFEQHEVELPSNIVILKRLISQLPSGVSRHTGAQIIRQTIEALGISMKSVLREAQEVQENLKASSRECQNNIQEYKKLISQLEKQSQNYQKQYGALNDLISLFVQTK